MKFKKLNEHTIECFISKQDLEDNGMSMEDLIKNPDKTNDFVHKVVSMSQREVDFSPSNSVLQAQIMPCEEGIIMLVFDKPTEKLGEYFLSQLKKRIKDAIQSGDKFNRNDENGDLPFDGEENFMSAIEEFMKDTSEAEIPEVMKEALKPGEEKCYIFPNFENLMDFIGRCDSKCVLRSTLYYQERNYFLVFDQGFCDDDEYEDFCELADEYGYMSADCDTRIQLIKEHTTPLIAKDAITVLKNTLV